MDHGKGSLAVIQERKDLIGGTLEFHSSDGIMARTKIEGLAFSFPQVAGVYVARDYHVQPQHISRKEKPTEIRSGQAFFLLTGGVLQKNRAGRVRIGLGMRGYALLFPKDHHFGL